MPSSVCPLWPCSQACDPFNSGRHADSQHKLQRVHQVGARLARPGSQHPLPSSIFHRAVLDLRRSHPDRTATVPRLPAVPGAADRPLARRQRKQQRQLLWRQRSWWRRCSWRRRCRWRRRWRYRRRRSLQPVRAAWFQPLSRAPQGVKRTRAGGRKHQAHEIGRLGHIESPVAPLCTRSDVLVTLKHPQHTPTLILRPPLPRPHCHVTLSSHISLWPRLYNSAASPRLRRLCQKNIKKWKSFGDHTLSEERKA